jgi:hypothetical protein
MFIGKASKSRNNPKAIAVAALEVARMSKDDDEGMSTDRELNSRDDNF